MDHLEQQWREEETLAHIHGWDFSHIHGRYEEEEDLPWDFSSVIARYLRPEHRLLDLDTGGGEFLLSLGHPYAHTAATENYPPNVALCQSTLLPLGVDFRPAPAKGPLPWPDAAFDRVTNRHGDFDPVELCRVLRPGGLFLTEQVGAHNDRELVDLLLPGTPEPFPDNHLESVSARFQAQGFRILEGREVFRPIRFYDVGALVWFARVLPWEFPGFSVSACLPRLRRAQAILEREGSLAGTIHRFLLIVQKI